MLHVLIVMKGQRDDQENDKMTAARNDLFEFWKCSNFRAHGINLRQRTVVGRLCLEKQLVVFAA